MKFTKLYILVVGLMFGFNLSAQVEDEVEFLYMKAKYLYDTDRHEDAVNAFNKVIKKDETYQDALVLRGASKFGLAAYKGAMNDFEKSIEVWRVTAEDLPQGKQKLRRPRNLKMVGRYLTKEN